ncbi:muconolactone Delta-isomerase [Edaphobacter modestus]|uniref:muconolactone Delta-isomerase n=1 Tax=Edaphobacter modestus TaxID=388466 RepID=A0A4Q7Y1D4_9BACT|nr:muconolactone Delta-isomerase family protein [Edaphobacter modestus]RZU29713.1 muconolactone D-isomerase [Edaphobacter modestus]
MEFLVFMELTKTIEGGSKKEVVLREQERLRSRQLSEKGVLLRLWRVPGRRANWGIWNANSCDELHDAIVSLPLFHYMTITVHPLASHPNDPIPLYSGAGK